MDAAGARIRGWLNSRGLPAERVYPLLFALAPIVMLSRALGPHKAPGLGTSMLYGDLYSGAQLRRWATHEAWLRSDLVVGSGTWWPDNLAAATWQAMVGAAVGDGMALGLLLFAGLFLCGYGPYRLVLDLADDRDNALLAAIVGGLVVQLSPPVLRTMWSGEIGLLGLGLAALALRGGPGWALLAGAWSTPAALLVGLFGLIRRRWTMAVALLPLTVALLSPPSHVPGAARQAVQAAMDTPAYVARNLAVLPLPPGELTDAVEPGAAPFGLGRLPAGVGVWTALLVGVAFGGRRQALAGLVAVGAYLGVFGLLPAIGLPPDPPPEWLVKVGTYVPGLHAPVGEASWLLPALLAAAVAASRVPRAWLLLVPAAVALRLENPMLTVPVTNVAPAPEMATLGGVGTGAVLVFPSPAPPWGQGHKSVAELLFDATRHGHPITISLGGDARAQAWLSQLADLAVDQSAAEEVWRGEGTDPLQAARDAGYTALLVDRSALPDAAWQRVDAALAARIGEPLARTEQMPGMSSEVGGLVMRRDWVVYDLQELAR